MNNMDMKLAKFATQVDERVLKELRSFAKSEDRSISKLVTEALSDYLKKIKIRPAFRNAMEEVLLENEELLKRLAK